MGSSLRAAKKYLILVVILLALTGCIPRIRRPALQPLRFEISQTKAEAKESVRARNNEQLSSLLQQESEKIVFLLTRYSTAAFLRPRSLEDGKGARLYQFFSSELGNELKKDWQALSLGESSSQVSRVTANHGKVSRLWIYYDDDLNPVVAAVDFELKVAYELKDGNKAALTNKGNFIFEPHEGGGWEISGYEVRQEFRSAEKKQAWKVSAGKSN